MILPSVLTMSGLKRSTDVLVSLPQRIESYYIRLRLDELDDVTRSMYEEYHRATRKKISTVPEEHCVKMFVCDVKGIPIPKFDFNRTHGDVPHYHWYARLASFNRTRTMCTETRLVPFAELFKQIDATPATASTTTTTTTSKKKKQYDGPLDCWGDPAPQQVVPVKSRRFGGKILFENGRMYDAKRSRLEDEQ
jgi:hypothetical protein